MVTLHRSAMWKIAIYGRDHGVPHFHIEGRDFRCSVSIMDLGLIIGTAPSAVWQEARDWASAHQAILMAKWQELNG